MHVIYYLILLILLAIGWFVNVLGLPGLWLMVAAFGLYALLTGWGVYVGWTWLIVMVVLAGLAEVVEFFAGAAGSAYAGGRKRGMVGAIAGGFLGGIFLTFLIPIPVVGTIVGACLGAFIGAAVMEFTDKDLLHSFRVGVGAAKGRFWGIVSKLAFGLAMFLVAMIVAFPIPRRQPTVAAPAPMTPASTLPATTTPVTTEPALPALPDESAAPVTAPAPAGS